MNRQHRNLLSALIGLGIAAIPASPVLGQQPPADFFTIRDVPLPGDSRFDYESLDSQSHRLYVTATGSNQVAVIEPQTLSVIATIPGGVYPDGLVYDPDLGKLYVSDETGGTDTVIDTTSNQVVATVPLGGEVGNTQYDPVSHQILVAVQTRNQVVTIDAQTDQVSGRYDTPGCDHPHGLQISPDRRMALVACEANAKLVVMDLQTMSITESHDVGTVPDVLAFDAPRRVLFVAAENGPLTALSETDNGLRPLAQRDVGPNAHAVAVDPETGHAYVPLANFGGQPVLRELSLSTASERGDED